MNHLISGVSASSAAIMAIEEVPGTTAGRRTARRFWFGLFSVAVTAGIFAYLFSTVSLAEVVGVVKGITLPWLVLFVFLSVSTSLFRTWRYRVLLRVSGFRPAMLPLFLITLVRNFFSDLLPARLGTLVYIYLVQSRLNIPFGAAASSFAHDFIFDMISLALMVTAAVLIQSSAMISPLIIVAGSFVLAAGSIAVLLLLPTILRVLAGLAPAVPLFSPKVKEAVRGSLAETARNVVITRAEGVFWRILALSLGVRFCKYFSLYVLLLGLVAPLGYDGGDFPLAKVFLGLCSAELAASLPISGIAGFGVYEGAWVLVFQMLGYPERIAALTSISHHLLTQVYGYSLGALALLVLLLPLPFGRGREAMSRCASPAGFWGAFAGAAVALTLGIFLLFPADLTTKDMPAATPGKIMGDGGKPAVPIDRVTGTLLYQRPDGIYTLDLHGKVPVRIVEHGTYPRWSPDGQGIALVQGNAIMVAGRRGEGLRRVATATRARAVCFTADGRALLFTDGKILKQVDLATLAVTNLWQDDEFLEVDMAGDGRRIAVTVRGLFGYRVKVFDLVTGEARTVAVGCSASLSPDGSLVTVNGGRHDELHLYNWDNLSLAAMIKAPPGLKFDNQFWSNHPQLLVATSEGEDRDIYLQNWRSNESLRLTESGDCDRADLHVTGPLP